MNQNSSLSQQPKFEPVLFDTDSPITFETLSNLLQNHTHVFICIRSHSGHQNRGGYFFFLKKGSDENITLETIEGEAVYKFTLPQLVDFINHASGLRYNQAMQMICQNFINFRSD